MASSGISLKKQLLDAAASVQMFVVPYFKSLAAELDDGRGIAATVSEIKDSEGRSSIHIAASEGNCPICIYLIDELKLDPNMKDDKGETPLHRSTLRGHHAATMFLLGRGANPDITNDKGLTPLHYASHLGNKRLVRLLLIRVVNVDALSITGTPLQRATCRGNLEVVKLLLEHHANPNVFFPHVASPLMASITVESLQCVKVLLEAGADPNAESIGLTPLTMAASQQDTKIIRCLLEAGADPNTSNLEGMTPLEVAAFLEDHQGFELLFPVTAPIPQCADWSFKGILDHLHSKAAQKQRNIKMKELFEDIKSKAKDAFLEKNFLLSSQRNIKMKELFEDIKSKAKDAFLEKDYYAAIFLYTKALTGDPLDPILLSNRSLCWACLKNGQAALTDAMVCIKQKPDWPKAHYRAGAAWRLLEKFGHAADSFSAGLKLDPENKDLRKAYQETVEEQMKSVNL